VNGFVKGPNVVHCKELYRLVGIRWHWKAAFAELKRSKSLLSWDRESKENSTYSKGKGKTVPLQAGSGPEGTKKLRFPDYMTTAQDGGKVVSLSTDLLYPQEMLLVLIFVRG